MEQLGREMGQERVEPVRPGKVHSGNHHHSEQRCYRSLKELATFLNCRIISKGKPTSIQRAAASLRPVSADGATVVGSAGSILGWFTTVLGTSGRTSEDWFLCLGCRSWSTAGQGSFAATLAAVRGKTISIRLATVTGGRAASSRFSVGITGRSIIVLSAPSIWARGFGVDGSTTRSASSTAVRGRVTAPSERGATSAFVDGAIGIALEVAILRTTFAVGRERTALERLWVEVALVSFTPEIRKLPKKLKSRILIHSALFSFNADLAS